MQVHATPCSIAFVFESTILSVHIYIYRVVHPTCAPLYLLKYALHEKMSYTKVTWGLHFHEENFQGIK